MTSAGKWSPCPWSQCRLKKKKKKRQNCANLFPLPIEALVLWVMQNNKKFTWKLSIERKPTKSHVSLLHSSASFRDSHNVSKTQRVRAENIYQPAIPSSFSIPRLAAMHLMMPAKKYSTVNYHALPSAATDRPALRLCMQIRGCAAPVVRANFISEGWNPHLTHAPGVINSGYTVLLSANSAPIAFS